MRSTEIRGSAAARRYGRLRAITAVAVALALVSCAGESKRSTPTEVPPPTGYSLKIAGSLIPSGPLVTEFMSVLLDGRLVLPATCSVIGCRRIDFAFPVGGVAAGSHILVFHLDGVLCDLTPCSATFTIEGNLRVEDASGVRENLALSRKTVVLQRGSSVEYPFEIGR